MQNTTMEFSTRNVLCFVLTILIYSHHTYGIWTREQGLPIPKPGIQMYCVDWITFYGFKDDDFPYNKHWAKERDYTMDKNTSTWAAMYAYALSGSLYKNVYLPEDFCNERDKLGIKYPFLTLQYEKKSCEDWIYLYGYSANDDTLNRLKAIHRDTSMDEYIALWADGYARFICKKKLPKYVLPSEYCEIIGKTRKKDLMPMVNRKGSQFSCEGWNDLFDYTDDVQNNYVKASKLHDLQFTHIHYWVRGYAAELRRRGINDLIAPKQFCESFGLDDYSRDFFRPETVVKMNLSVDTTS